MIVTEEHKAALDAVANDRGAAMKAPEPPVTLQSLHGRLNVLENRINVLIEKAFPTKIETESSNG